MIQVQTMQRDRVAIYAYVAFLAARVFKSDPRLDFLPVDPTVLFAVVTCFFVVPRLARLRFDPDLALLGSFFVLLLVPALWMSDSEYATDKVLRLFTLTAFAAVAPFAIIRTRPQRRVFVDAVLVFAVILSIDLASKALLLGVPAVGRFGGFESQVIWAGRLAGSGIVILAARFARSDSRAILRGGLAFLLAFSVSMSGSRGPAVATVVSVVAVLWLGFYKLRLSSRRVLLVVVVVVSVGAALGQTVPSQNIDRLTSIVAADGLRSSAFRFDYAKVAAGQVASAPIGIGWGGFGDQLRASPVNSEGAEYPHNILLEVGAEAGWAALLLLLFMLILATHRLFRFAPWDVDTLAIFGLFLFFFLAAQFSGDVNSNRMLFALVGIALAIRPSRPSAAGSDETRADLPVSSSGGQ